MPGKVRASLKLCRDKRARNSGYHLIIITGIDYADMAAIPNERGASWNDEEWKW